MANHRQSFTAVVCRDALLFVGLRCAVYRLVRDEGGEFTIGGDKWGARIRWDLRLEILRGERIGPR